MASVRRTHKSKRWQAQFRVAGRLRSKATSVEIPDEGGLAALERSRRQALAEAEQLERMANEEPDQPKTVHLGDLERVVLEAVASDRYPVADQTKAGYRATLRKFREFAGQDRPLKEIDARIADQFRAQLEAERYAPGTVRKRLETLKLIWDHATEAGLIPKDQPNPFQPSRYRIGQRSRSRKLATRERTLERKPFSPEEVAQLREAADEEWSTAIAIAFFTGLRLGDVANLQWADVDMAGREIRTQTRKTGDVVRIPLFQPLAGELSKTPEKDRHGPVLPGLAGRPQPSLSRCFSRIVQRSCVAVDRHDSKRPTATRSFHSLRHGAATWMAAAGIDEATRRKILGHSTAQVSDRYFHADAGRIATQVENVPSV